MHDALSALHLCGDKGAVDAAGAECVRRDGMCLSIAAKLPDTAVVLNHGFVYGGEDSFLQAAGIYRRSGVRHFFLSTVIAPKAVVLDRAGLVAARGWRKFRRPAKEPLPPLSKNTIVQEVEPGAAQGFARIVSDAFDLGLSSRPWLATLPEAPGWHAFQAWEDGEVAGTGALYIQDGYAWTDFGATRPESRGRGIQKAMLAHRIRFARSLGCHTVLTCTGEAVAGDAQISYRNILAAGFVEADLILNLAPA